jgi:ribosomal protein S20
LAKTPRKWQGARTPSGLKRVRSSERRHAILQPRRSAAKTLVRNAVAVATTPADGADPQAALALAISALDRAAKVGAIHPNAAARRKSRLATKVAALVGGETVQAGGRATKQTGAAAAAKAAKARIAAGKAAKAKGAQTAAGKARAALTRSARTEAATPAAPAEAPAAAATTTRRSSAKSATAKSATAKGASSKTAAAKTSSAKATAKAAPKTTAKAAPKTTAKAAPKTTAKTTRTKSAG